MDSDVAWDETKAVIVARGRSQIYGNLNDDDGDQPGFRDRVHTLQAPAFHVGPAEDQASDYTRYDGMSPQQPALDANGSPNLLAHNNQDGAYARLSSRVLILDEPA